MHYVNDPTTSLAVVALFAVACLIRADEKSLRGWRLVAEACGMMAYVTAVEVAVCFVVAAVKFEQDVALSACGFWLGLTIILALIAYTLATIAEKLSAVPTQLPDEVAAWSA